MEDLGAANGHTIDTMPLNAAICEPTRGAILKPGGNRIRGYAVSGDRTIVRVVVSGNGDADAGDEPTVMRSYLRARGVPSSVIVDDPAGYDTERSCRRLPDVIGRDEASRDVVIVTQDFHLGRAIALCRSRGVDAVGIEAQCGDCSIVTLARNHFREALLARPRALIDAVWP